MIINQTFSKYWDSFVKIRIFCVIRVLFKIKKTQMQLIITDIKQDYLIC